jgi:regulator of protease activity HflC (stomatin/prohibitin superfamily)
MRLETMAGAAGVFFVALIIGGFILVAGFDTVDASHIGVKNRFGQITGTMLPGMQWTGVFTHVEQYDLRIRTMTVDMSGVQGAVDKDGQSVYATIQVNYRLNPETVIDAYSKVSTDSEMARILNIEGTIKEGFKTITAHYPSLEIFQKRDDIKAEAIKEIEANFPKHYFILDNVIVSNLDFNPEFKAAIEGRKVAEEVAKQREQQVSVSKFEADMKIQTARGESESVKLKADGEAYQRLAIAQSEAEAIRLKKEQITPLMVQNNWIDRWNGQLPSYMLTSEGNTNMLLQLPTGQ